MFSKHSIWMSVPAAMLAIVTVGLVAIMSALTQHSNEFLALVGLPAVSTTLGLLLYSLEYVPHCCY